jgi:D-alanine-D-alanine ligase
VRPQFLLNKQGMSNGMSRFGKVAVLLGGRSAERGISLESGEAVLQALLGQRIESEGLEPDAECLGRLAMGEFDRVFIALHGRGGEDGSIQGALEALGVPYTGSGVLGSAVAMDKRLAKYVWLGAGLPTPPFIELDPGFDPDRVVESLGLPLMVKPAREGSSLGASRVVEIAGLIPAYTLAASFDERVIAERWITGAEYTVGVLGEDALPLIRLETPRLFYDYEAKYHDDRTRYLCPAGLPEATERALQVLALRGFRALDGRGWGRVDFLVDGEERPWLIEVNTVPGMTGHSLVPMAAKAAGLSFETLVVRILETAGIGTAFSRRGS